MGTRIAKAFKHVFASSFYYNDGIAEKPATAINYTNKTQHLFRINKGIFNYYENKKINQHTPHEGKYIQFSNMIYIGDGETDVPCMKMVMYQGGHAIAVYNPLKENSRDTALELFDHKRTNFIAPTDYSKGSEIENIVKLIVDKIDTQSKCSDIKNKTKKELEEYKRKMLCHI
jgi:hypothetical protein